MRGDVAEKTEIMGVAQPPMAACVILNVGGMGSLGFSGGNTQQT